MLLYHFTYTDALPAILADGLTKGELPLSPTDVLPEHVWLTTDSSPKGHGLSACRPLSAEERTAIESINRKRLPDKELFFPDKMAARITVRIPSADRA